MGKTSKPLTIVAIGACAQWEELAKLEAQGHTIRRVLLPEKGEDHWPQDNLRDADIILGPTCWRMDEAHRQYLPLAIKEARMLKYPRDKRQDLKERAAVTEELDLDNLTVVGQSSEETDGNEEV